MDAVNSAMETAGKNRARMNVFQTTESWFINDILS